MVARGLSSVTVRYETMRGGCLGGKIGFWSVFWSGWGVFTLVGVSSYDCGSKMVVLAAGALSWRALAVVVFTFFRPQGIGRVRVRAAQDGRTFCALYHRRGMGGLSAPGFVMLR